MQIQLNGEPRTLPLDACLQNLIAELNIGTQAIAVAVNRQVISRSKWSQYRLNHGDQVDVVRAIGGG